ncbi:DNA-directed RNA polymerase subunit delta [Anoxybacillus calidus]|uniref:Probable DNA-directed RNA polymerase subunit delta n=1 Tax=[Anoxybacillus] calidus TaxID=575178 RepID=A0A7V9Z2C9_9BACL|nr:DNA-directed RNA polymerase subunit delta [Anoxybacillus calidus]MBA2872797.1 DNA-directed RNA polymerase subunit delta [Anoxybacillus calidus]
MSLEQYSQEELQEMSLVELAYLVLSDKKEAVSFQQLVNEIAAILHLSEEEVRGRIAQFYTDLNIDGRFICIGENRWGLRAWYPYDQIEEETAPVVKTTKKKKKVLDEYDDFDEIDEEELEYDALDDFEDDIDLDDEDIIDDEFDLDDPDEFDEELLDDEEFDLGDEDLEDELDVDDEAEEEEL